MTFSWQGTALRRTAALTFALAAVASAGCAPQPALDIGTGTALQEQVARVRTDMAHGRYGDVLASLDRLVADVERNAAEGRISPERKTRIMNAISIVRSDAQAALPSAPASVPPSQTPTSPKDEKSDDEKKDEGKGDDKDKGKD
jgi:hypothetical protein